MRRPGLKVLVLSGAVVALGLFLTKSLSHLPCTILGGADILSIKLGDVAPGSVRAFCYRDQGGQKLRFLLARDETGRVHTVFDACGQCYKFRKGYTYSGHYLVCRLCGNRYSIADVKVGKGSCVPVPLKSTTEHNQARIKVADVKAGKWMF
jgi:uncharacterized membrane protein